MLNYDVLFSRSIIGDILTTKEWWARGTVGARHGGREAWWAPGMVGARNGRRGRLTINTGLSRKVKQYVCTLKKLIIWEEKIDPP